MKKLAKEFKEFISRGNVLDMAIGVIIATAFGAITTTLVNNILMPLIGLITGGRDFTEMLNWTVKEAVVGADGEVVSEAVVIAFGSLLSAVLNFVIIALICFAIVKAFNKANEVANAKKLAEQAAEEAKKAEEPVPPTAEELLTEIRDLLSKK